MVKFPNQYFDESAINDYKFIADIIIILNVSTFISLNNKLLANIPFVGVFS